MNWEFKQRYPENDTRAQNKTKHSEVDNENTELCEMSPFENIYSWLDTQDVEKYESCTEDLESDMDTFEEGFYSCLAAEMCSTLRREPNYLKPFGEISAGTLDDKNEKEELQREEMFYSLQIRRKSRTIFNTM